MSTTTDREIEGAKKKASVACESTTAKTRVKKIAASTPGAATAGKRKSASSNVTQTNAASERPEHAMPKASTRKSREDDGDDITADEVGTETQDEENSAARGSDGDGRKAGTSCRGCVNAGKPLTETGKKRLVDKLLGLAETQATQGSFKITPADLIRLMQLHKEMNPQRDRKVIVQWIEDRPE